MILNKKVLFDNDIKKDSIKGKTIGVIGYGNQGRSQALNLNDSGYQVLVGLRVGSKSKAKVSKDRLKYDEILHVFKNADVLAIMIPDNEIDQMLLDNIQNLKKGQTILVSHGYSILYGEAKLPSNVNVVMVAPSGGGGVVRSEYQKGFGVPALVAVQNDYSGDALDIALSYAKAIGSSKAAVFLSTFKEETETDLFGEQVILTGSIPMIVIQSYKVLLEEGYDPVVSWFVCFYELKTIVDLMFKKGMSSFYDMVSSTARYGGASRGSMLIDDNFKDKIREILKNIKSGDFKKELEESLSKGDDGARRLRDVFNSKEFDIVEKEILKRIKKN